MARIEFKGKVKTMHYADDTVAYTYLDVPSLDRKHCDMSAFRSHPKYGAYANSDLFLGMLNRIKVATFGESSRLKLDAIPEGVTVDTSGFLAVVSFDV